MNVDAGVIGGEERPTSQFVVTLDQFSDTGDAEFTRASSIQDVQLPLSDAGTDVVVRIASVTCGTPTFCPPAPGLLIDDVQLSE